MIEDWRSLSWIRNSALWSIGFWLRRIDHQQQDSQVINWDGLFIQESQWGKTYCGYLTRTYCKETPQYKWHWNVKSIQKQSGCWLRKIVWTIMKDQKESFMDKDMLWESTPVYMVQGSQNTEWSKQFKGSDCWWRQITWTLVSGNSIGCQEYKFKNILWGNPPVSTAWDVKSTKPSEERPTVDIWKRCTVRNPPV